jgi:hypothetical protein
VFEVERYNKIYLALWVLFSAVALTFMLAFIIYPLTELYDNMALWFFLLLFSSEVIGIIFASLLIDRVSFLYMHFSTIIVCRLALIVKDI